MGLVEGRWLSSFFYLVLICLSEYTTCVLCPIILGMGAGKLYYVICLCILGGLGIWKIMDYSI